MTRSQRLDELVASVEDLLARLPARLTPEIADLRDKVDAGIFAAWTEVARDRTDAWRRAEMHSGGRLWAPVGLALLAGATSLLAYRFTRSAARLS